MEYITITEGNLERVIPLSSILRISFLASEATVILLDGTHFRIGQEAATKLRSTLDTGGRSLGDYDGSIDRSQISDPALEALAYQFFGLPVLLVTKSGIVAGTTVNRSEYFDSIRTMSDHEIIQDLATELEGAGENISDGETSVEPEHVHLKDVTLFVGAQRINLAYVRVRLNGVIGFYLGSIQDESPIQPL